MGSCSAEPNPGCVCGGVTLGKGTTGLHVPLGGCDYPCCMEQPLWQRPGLLRPLQGCRDPPMGHSMGSRGCEPFPGCPGAGTRIIAISSVMLPSH